MPRLTGLALLLAACSTAALGPEQQADQLRRAGALGEAYGEYARALCAAPERRLDLARRLVELWRALDMPGSPLARLEGCDVDAAVLAFIEGLAAGAAGDVEAADAALVRAAALAPEAAVEIAYRRGLVALGADRGEAALDHLGRAASLEPERSDVRIALAQARSKVGQHDRVAQELRAALRGRPSRAEIERGRHVLEAAVRAAEPALPDGVAITLSEALAALEKNQLAQPELVRLLALSEQIAHPRVLTVAGIAAMSIGARDEAARLLEMAASANPYDPEPLRVLGLAHYAAERPADALPALRRALARDPLDAEVARMLAAAAASAGELDTARQCYETLIALEPESAEHHLNLARTERQLGHPEAAGRAVERGYAIDSRSIPLLLERAVIHATLARSAPTESERHAAAARTRATVSELLSLAPDHPGAQPIIESLNR